MKHYFFFLMAAITLAACSGNSKSSKPVYPTNCTVSLAGSYTGTDICPSSNPSSYPCTITASTSTNITISNLYGVPVIAELNCTNNSITVPAQNFSGNFSISGTGSYTSNTITIYWNSTSSGVPTSCTTTYTR